MSKTYTKDEICEMFLDDHRIVQMSLATSFRKYATRRDELIEKYVDVTGLPESFFTEILSYNLYKELNGIK